jgi:hypothetical protein
VNRADDPEAAGLLTEMRSRFMDRLLLAAESGREQLHPF